MSWWEHAYRAGRVAWDPGEYDGHLPWLLDAYGIAPGEALDAGCGNGKSAVWLAERGFRVTGIDLAPTAIEQARALARERGVAGRTRFVAGAFPEDVDDLPGGSFQLVTERAFLQHVGGEAAVRRALRRIAALLAPDGIFYSVIIAGRGVPRFWSMARVGEEEVRALMEPFFVVREIRKDVFTPGEPGSMAAWISVMSPRESREQGAHE